MPRPDATAHDSRARRYAVRRVVRPSPARIHAPEPGAWLPLPELSLLPALTGPSVATGTSAAGRSMVGAPTALIATGATALLAPPTTTPTAPLGEPPAQARAAVVKTSPVSDETAESRGPRTGLRGRLLILAGLTAAVLVALPFLPTVGAAERTVVVDGKPIRLAEEARLASALRDAGVWIGPADRVLPSPDAPVSSLKSASIRRAVPLYVDVDGEHRYMLSAAANPAELHQELGLGDRLVATTITPGAAAVTTAAGATAVNVASPAAPTATPSSATAAAAFTPGSTVVFRTQRHVYLFMDGQQTEYDSTSLTVQEFLTERNVTLGVNDTVDPAVATRFTTGNAVTVTRFGTDTRTVVESIPMTTVQRSNAQLAKGETRVTDEGSPGLRQVKYQRQVRDGQVVGESLLSNTIVRAMVPRRVDVGTKVTTSAPASSSGSTQQGNATWYASPFGSDSCASTSVPKGTVVTVTNLNTGASTTCRVMDYGPVPAGRIIDLDDDVFAQLAPLSTGVFPVRVEY